MTEKEAREIRDKLLKAFDVYKSNVEYGIETETENEHKAIIEWYNTMLKLPLDEDTYKKSPEKIKRYLPKLK